MQVSDFPCKLENKKQLGKYLAWTFCALMAVAGGFLQCYSAGSGNSIQPMNTYVGRNVNDITPHSAPTFLVSVGGNDPVAVIPYTLINNQNTATARNFTQQITVNTSKNASYYSADLSNVNWQDSNGNILPSWLEGFISSLSSNVTYWVNLGNNIIAANGGTLTIYEVIYSTSVNVMDANVTGAFPWWPGNSYYGQYDNGWNVFPFYANFNGSYATDNSNSSIANFNMACLVTGGICNYTVNNGLNVSGYSPTTGSWYGIHIYSANSQSGNVSEMYLANVSSTPTKYWGWDITTCPNGYPPSLGSGNNVGLTAAYRYGGAAPSSGSAYYRLFCETGGNGSRGSVGHSGSYTFPSAEIATIRWSATGTEQGFINYTSQVVSATNANVTATSTSYVDVDVEVGNNTPQSIAVNWTRTRIDAPNGIMPATAVGSLFSLPNTISSLIAASASQIDQGQNSTLTSTVIGGFPPIQYQWYVQGPDASSFTNITGATGASYTFASTTINETGMWSFQVCVTDNNGTAVNSSSISILLNAPLVVPIVANDTIDLGQLATLSNSSNVINGTPPYSYQWMSSPTLAGPYTTIPGATNLTYNFTPDAVGITYYVLRVTDNASHPVTENTSALEVVVNVQITPPTVSSNPNQIYFNQSSLLSNSSETTTGTAPYSYKWLNSTNLAGPYAVIPSATNASYNFTPWAIGTWYFELNVTDSANQTVTVTSNVAEVVVQPFSGAITIQPSSAQTKTQRANATFSFKLTDANTGIAYPQNETSITVSFATSNTFDLDALTWSNGPDNGIFNATIDTHAIPAGSYTLTITFSRQNYADVIQAIALMVAPYQPAIQVPSIVSVTENTEAVITISVTDALLGQQFDAINITWNIAGTTLSGQITQVNSTGNYTISFPTNALAAPTDYQLQITIQVTIGGVVYPSTSTQTVIVRVEYVNILGIPRPYFWILVGGIAAAIGSFVVYSAVKRVRIPLTLKKINRIQKNIKHRRVHRDIVTIISREEVIGKMQEDNLAFLELDNKNLRTQRERDSSNFAKNGDSPQGDNDYAEVPP